MSVKEAVLIPLLKAIITGALFALFGAAFYWLSLGVTGWRIFWAILAGAALVSWLMVIRIGDQDRNAANLKPSKVYPVETTRIQITASDPAGEFSAGRWAELPISAELLQRVAKRLAAGSSFSHAGLAGPGRPLSRSEFECLRDAMISRGLCYWTNPAAHAQGCQLTRAGVAVMRHFASCSSVEHPLPQLARTSRHRELLPSAALAHTDTRDNGREAIIDRLTD